MRNTYCSGHVDGLLLVLVVLLAHFGCGRYWVEGGGEGVSLG